MENKIEPKGRIKGSKNRPPRFPAFFAWVNPEIAKYWGVSRFAVKYFNKTRKRTPKRKAENIMLYFEAIVLNKQDRDLEERNKKAR
jgi:hypothetical protein